jgi:copper(I)-binding protein
LTRLFAPIALCLLPAVALAAEPLTIEDAWVRALPPTQPTTAAYMTLTNPGAGPVEVRGASAEITDRVEIHTVEEVDGMMRMRQLPSLTVAAGETVALEPGGAHLMLFGLDHMPAPGESVRLCLQLASGEEVCTVAAARKPQARQSGDGEPGAHDHHAHH